MENEPAESNAAGIEPAEMSLEMLRAEVERARRGWKTTEEELRETLAAMIQHQQVGKCGNFRYNTITGAITGTEEVFKIFQFPPGTRGCTVEEWLVKLHADDRARVEQQFFEVIQAVSDMRFEYRIVMADGEVKHIRCDGEPDLEFKGELTYFGVLTDVTERRAAEQAQRAMEAELSSALRLASMGELAGSIIHEVNQPLSAITASSAACRRWMIAGPDRIDRALASLDRVVEEGERAAAIIRGLRSLIHNVSTEPAPFDFDGATREVCSMLMAELARENVLLTTRFAPGLPWAFGNRVQIQQVLMNLARNAIEAMRASKVRRVLTISTACDEQMLSLRVADTGPGVSMEDAERLFAPLYTTKVGGMGLGLSISRKIAIAHGGTLEAEPHAEGAIFHLRLPVEQQGHA